LITRLLLRRPKVHPLLNLINSYSPELGEEGVKQALLTLSIPITFPPGIHQEPEYEVPIAGPSNPVPLNKSDTAVTPLRAARSYQIATPAKTTDSRRADSGSSSLADPLKTPKVNKTKKPWADLPTGLSLAEEKADPELAEAIRESLWASKVSRIEVDDAGTDIPSPIPAPSRSVSASSTSTRKSDEPVSALSKCRDVSWNEPFSLAPIPPPPIHYLARNETSLTLEEIMSAIGADELRKVARSRQVPSAKLQNRQAVENALKQIARGQGVLGFTPVKSTKSQNSNSIRHPTLSNRSTMTSGLLLLSTLLPLLGGHALVIAPALYALIGRVNLIFTRTPPLSSTAPSLMLPSILVQSHKRRYPDYGTPTRSVIWQTRDDLLVWERVVEWEAKISDALGENWGKDTGTPVWAKEQLARTEGAEIVKTIWHSVWPVWQEMVAGQGAHARTQAGLMGDRFETGHSLTRIVYKAS